MEPGKRHALRAHLPEAATDWLTLFGAGLSIYWEIRVFPRAVGNTGKYWEIPGNTGK